MNKVDKCRDALLRFARDFEDEGRKDIAEACRHVAADEDSVIRLTAILVGRPRRKSPRAKVRR